ncbi:hypothetical protein STRPS_2022 [Streptococcus pseudoporcinus LQ 940-04]|uniref:Transcription regulator n=1 Tax=Streptococcus pseudoporcinus LQ 940-04 TaxID=875093 RepID=G5KAQ9_9STRE|nr:hypothetical protein HMPREF9320_0662 [Streptococcus pseudoporcinus SPIN 20026]EHI64574.1 hypothetical protein STRPS_2022 [Streptococcus pseudoporcinus LQ 940-04]
MGETVEFIRHSKNIPIKQVCGDYLTRQTYYRFIKNNLDISSKKLLYILDNFNVNVDEFYSREFEGFIKGFSWHNDFSSFPLNFVSTLLYQVQIPSLVFFGVFENTTFLLLTIITVKL